MKILSFIFVGLFNLRDNLLNMEKRENKDVYKIYDKIAAWFFKHRDNSLIEKNYLDKIIKLLPPEGKILDLGCGTGKPILQYLLQNNLDVTGLDASTEMLKIAKANFPSNQFILQDMRRLNIDRRFHAIIAWHSFFHLPAADQAAMFQIFEEHLYPGGVLLFTSGSEDGEAWGINGGEDLFHASLDRKEYERLLVKHHFNVLEYTEKDPNCGEATIWMAQYSG